MYAADLLSTMKRRKRGSQVWLELKEERALSTQLITSWTRFSKAAANISHRFILSVTGWRYTYQTEKRCAFDIYSIILKINFCFSLWGRFWHDTIASHTKQWKTGQTDFSLWKLREHKITQILNLFPKITHGIIS